MDERQKLEIYKEEDRLNIAKILVANGYTVRIVKVKSGNGNRATTILEYYKEK